MMGVAAYAFHWTADQFWRATPHEFFAAYEIWQEANSPSED
jgi:hypothetical protein